MRQGRHVGVKKRPGQETDFFHRSPPVRLRDERVPQSYGPTGLRKYSDGDYARVDTTSPPMRNIYVVLEALALTSIGVFDR